MNTMIYVWSFVWAAVDFDIWVRLMVKLLRHMGRVVAYILMYI